MNTKRIIMIIGIILLSVIGAIALYRAKSQQEDTGKLSVTASFYPLAHFAEKVGGDLVAVRTIVPTGSEPHDFEPTAQDIAQMQQSKLFIYNGASFDPWAERIVPDLTANGVTAVKMSQGVELITGEAHGHESAAEDHEEAVVEGESVDPHFWLDPIRAQGMVQTIADQLSAVDPDHQMIYEANATAYIAELATLDQAYRSGLANCQKQEIITSHAAFGYLANRYNFSVYAIAGLSPDQEPSAQQLAELSDFADTEEIDYIFFETLASSRLAETLANEIEAQTLVFNPLEGLTKDEIVSGHSYISIMQENLKNLRTALACNPV